MAIKKQFTYSQNTITAIVEDGYYLWVAFQGSSESCKLYKVSALNPDIIYFDIDITANKIVNMKTDGNYVYAALDSENYVAVRISKVDPIYTNYYYSIPAGVNEVPSDLEIDSYLQVITPGSISGENPKLMRFNKTGSTHYETVDITDVSITIENLETIVKDENNNLWAMTNSNPAVLVKLYDDGGYTNDTWEMTLSGETLAYCLDSVYNNNTIYVACNTNPASIIVIDIESADYPNWSITTLNNSGEDYQYAKSIALNSTFEYLYLGFENGRASKIELSNLSNRTEIDINIASGSNALTTVAIIDDIYMTFFGTDDSSDELYQYDESTISRINTHFVFLRRITEQIKTIFNFIKGALINTDFRFLATTKSNIKTDLRFSPYNYDNITATARTDFTVKIDGNIISDIVLPSIIVNHQADDISTAEFTLTRYFDKPDYDLEENLSEITNNNAVTIYIKDNLIFSGNIRELVLNADGESIRVHCKSSDEWTKLVTTVNIPIPSKTEQLHLYHAQVKSVNIQKPDYTKGVTTFSGITCIAGSKIIIATSGTFDRDEMEGKIIDIISGDNFITGSYTLVNVINSTQAELDRIPTIKSRESHSYEEYLKGGSNGIGYVVIDNTNYRGIKVELGDTEEEIVNNSANLESESDLALDIYSGDFNPDQNWTYFWFTSGIDLLNDKTWNDEYLGTTIASIAGSLYHITGVYYRKQRIYNNLIFRNGAYYVGTYPYKEVSVKNGKYIAKYKYEDREDGFYQVLSEHYDFLQYAQDVADLEYQKIKNINGDISPISSATIDLTIDGYLYYNLALATRINITNTTQSEVYKNNNGFPLSIKNIEINSQEMKVHLTLNNQKSEYELKTIDELYPEEPTVTEEQNWLLNNKFDLNQFNDIS